MIKIDSLGYEQIYEAKPGESINPGDGGVWFKTFRGIVMYKINSSPDQHDVLYTEFYFRGTRYTDNPDYQVYLSNDLEANAQQVLNEAYSPYPTQPVYTPGEVTPTTPTYDITIPSAWKWLIDLLSPIWTPLDGIWKWLTDPASGLHWILGNLGTVISGAITGLGSAISGISIVLGALGGNIVKAFTDGTADIIEKAVTDGASKMATSVTDALGHTPAWREAMDASGLPFANANLDLLMSGPKETGAELNTTPYAEALDKVQALNKALLGAELAIYGTSLVVETASLGQVETVAKLMEAITQSPVGIRLQEVAILDSLEKTIFNKARKQNNFLYRPNTPDTGNLINMRMKEIIGQNDFEENLAYQGYSKEWATKFWDAHFGPPSLTDIITAYRRGIEVKYPKSDPASGEIVWIGPKALDLSDVRYLLESIDLDPRYIDIFMTRIHNDVPITYARWMWETGAITTRDQVLEIVRRQGVDPQYENNVVDMVTGFAVRAYRRRYWVALQMALTKGVITEAEVKAGIADNPVDATIDYWMIKTAQVRKLIADKGIVSGGEKLLALGDVKKAYINEIMNEDTLRTDLMGRGYSLTDIQTLIDVLNLDRISITTGKKVVALSVSEMINAWRYDVWTEDKIRIELSLRGLSQSEIDTMISTYKAKWGVAEQQG
jgi:hypothetical protein